MISSIFVTFFFLNWGSMAWFGFFQFLSKSFAEYGSELLCGTKFEFNLAIFGSCFFWKYKRMTWRKLVWKIRDAVVDCSIKESLLFLKCTTHLEGRRAWGCEVVKQISVLVAAPQIQNGWRWPLTNAAKPVLPPKGHDFVQKDTCVQISSTSNCCSKKKLLLKITPLQERLLSTACWAGCRRVLNILATLSLVALLVGAPTARAHAVGRPTPLTFAPRLFAHFSKTYLRRTFTGQSIVFSTVWSSNFEIIQ